MDSSTPVLSVNYYEAINSLLKYSLPCEVFRYLFTLQIPRVELKLPSLSIIRINKGLLNCEVHTPRIYIGRSGLY